jgi:putative transposase
MKRRLSAIVRQPLVAPSQRNQIWTLDYMQDALYSGRVFRTLNVIDESNREGLAIEVAISSSFMGLIETSPRFRLLD